MTSPVWTRARRRSDRGAISTELAVVMTPFLAAFVLLVVFAGRFAQAENDVRSATHDAARAASLMSSPTRAENEARRIAEANLTTSGLSCRNGLDVAVDTAEFRPGGWVAVTVTCHAAFGDLAPLEVPGSRAFASTSTAIIDTYRADNP